MVYVAGYLIHTVLRKKHCEDCAVALLKENSEMLENSEALLLNKNYGCSSTITFLKRPADTFIEVVSFMLNKFNVLFNQWKNVGREVFCNH